MDLWNWGIGEKGMSCISSMVLGRESSFGPRRDVVLARKDAKGEVLLSMEKNLAFLSDQDQEGRGADDSGDDAYWDLGHRHLEYAADTLGDQVGQDEQSCADQPGPD